MHRVHAFCVTAFERCTGSPRRALPRHEPDLERVRVMVYASGAALPLLRHTRASDCPPGTGHASRSSVAAARCRPYRRKQRLHPNQHGVGVLCLQQGPRQRVQRRRNGDRRAGSDSGLAAAVGFSRCNVVASGSWADSARDAASTHPNRCGVKGPQSFHSSNHSRQVK